MHDWGGMHGQEMILVRVADTGMSAAATTVGHDVKRAERPCGSTVTHRCWLRTGWCFVVEREGGRKAVGREQAVVAAEQRSSAAHCHRIANALLLSCSPTNPQPSFEKPVEMASRHWVRTGFYGMGNSPLHISTWAITQASPLPLRRHY